MAKKPKWRRHTLEFKRQAVERMKTCPNIHELARELKVQRKLLYVWRNQLEGRPEPRHANLGITAEDRKEKQHREEIAKLKAAVADKTLEKSRYGRCRCKRAAAIWWSIRTYRGACRTGRRGSRTWPSGAELAFRPPKGKMLNCSCLRSSI